MRLVRVLATCIAACAALSARAQVATQFDVERLQLDPSARGSLVLGTGEVAPRNSFRLGVAGHWEHRPLVSVGGDLLGRRTDAAAIGVIDDRQTVHATLDYVPFERIELYGRLAYVVNQESERGITLAEKRGFGTPSFGIRVGALQQADGQPLNAAVAFEFMPPWGTAGALAKFSDPGAVVRLELGRAHGPMVVAVNAGISSRSTFSTGSRSVGPEAQYGAVVALQGAIRPELSFRGGVDLQEGPASAELLAGLRAKLGPGELFALGGPGFFDRLGTPQWRGLVGLAFGLDGARAKEEAPAPPPPPPPPPTPPPPPPPADPCAAGQAHTPAQCPDLDDDGDGILNKDDACPMEKGIPELKGCPAKDADGDGVPDHLDRCPNEAGPADSQGCPRVEVKKEAKKIELREKVQFATGKAAIRPESASLLDEVARVMKEHPEITKVVVEGHTDSVGGKALNQKLSQARAESVRKALVQRGVEPARLAAKGFGPSKPIAPNDTAEGREANRRVEISIAEMK